MGPHTRKAVIFTVSVFIGELLFFTGNLDAQERFRIAQSDGTIWLTQNIASRVLTAAYREIGLEIKMVSYPPLRAVIEADRGEDVDGILARMQRLDLDYTNLVRIPVPVGFIDILAFTEGDTDLQISDWDDLAPYRIGYMRGNILSRQRMEGMEAYDVSTPVQGILMLLSKRIDVFVESRDIVLTLEESQRKRIRIIEPPLEVIPLYHYVHRRYAHLVPDLEDSLRKLHETGEFDRIVREETAKSF